MSSISERIVYSCDQYKKGSLNLNEIRLRFIAIFATWGDKDIEKFIKEMSTKNGEG